MNNIHEFGNVIQRKNLKEKKTTGFFHGITNSMLVFNTFQSCLLRKKSLVTPL